MNKNRNLWSR